ncbi:hypothetical protein LX32DRAFT_146424 [Colletotrichum zoysiae]|uniref:Uncharacterized protein n=1 Tax=Colletotrichum zoysiae TaxID=1216348 RepID=A0AAD9H891_9PEZI|nr:hypothetical protein LX32DRAFT_146424 [Colletotrichum zoysiae]
MSSFCAANRLQYVLYSIQFCFWGLALHEQASAVREHCDGRPQSVELMVWSQGLERVIIDTIMTIFTVISSHYSAFTTCLGLGGLVIVKDVGMHTPTCLSR